MRAPNRRASRGLTAQRSHGCHAGIANSVNKQGIRIFLLGKGLPGHRFTDLARHLRPLGRENWGYSMAGVDYKAFVAGLLDSETRWADKMEGPFLTRCLMLALIRELVDASRAARKSGTQVVVSEQYLEDGVQVALNGRSVIVTRAPRAEVIEIKFLGVPETLMPDGTWRHELPPFPDPAKMKKQAEETTKAIMRALVLTE